MLDRLTEKVGPLPVWGWGGIVGVLIIAYLYFTNWRGVSGGESSGKGGGSAGSSDAIWDAYHGAGGGATPGVTTGPEPIASNLQWLAQGVRVAVSQGYPGTTAQVALQRFLAGESLTTSQQAIVNAVIAVIGPPPEGTDYINELIDDPVTKVVGPTRPRPNPWTKPADTTPLPDPRNPADMLDYWGTTPPRQHEIPGTTLPAF